MVQSVFIVRGGFIKGWGGEAPKFKKKKCKYCGKMYTPTHPHNLYCNSNCRSNSDREHTEERVRRYRKRYHGAGNDKAILNVGTGELGEHRCESFQEEFKKIQTELRKHGLKSTNSMGV